MVDSSLKTVRDLLKTHLLAAPASFRKVYDMDTPDAKIFPHAVLLIMEAEVNANDYQTFALDTNRHQVIILVRDNNPERVRLKMQTVQTLWQNATRYAALAAVGGHMVIKGVFAPTDDNAGKMKGTLTGVLSFELDIRYTY